MPHTLHIKHDTVSRVLLPILNTSVGEQYTAYSIILDMHVQV
jgi:hypothetical protein